MLAPAASKYQFMICLKFTFPKDVLGMQTGTHQSVVLSSRGSTV